MNDRCPILDLWSLGWDYRSCLRPPAGISHVFINGRASFTHGKIAGAISGMVLRRKH